MNKNIKINLLGGGQPLRMALGTIALALLLAGGASATAESILTYAQINGQTLEVSNPIVIVSPGETLTGRMDVQMRNDCSTCIIPSVGINNWERTYTDLGGISGNWQWYTKSYSIAFNAPNTAGDYYIAVGHGPCYVAADLVYGCYGIGDPRRGLPGGGDDLWDVWTPTDWEAALPGGSKNEFRAIKIKVSTPTALWHFNGDAKDSSGNGNHGTINGATLASGISDQGLSFDGSDWVDIPDNIAPSQITLAAWIKLTDYDDSDGAPVITKETGSGYASDFGWRLFIHKGSHKIAFEASNGIASSSALSNTVLSTDKWYYVVGTYDGSKMKIYVNGVLDGTSDLTGNLNQKSMPTAIGHLQGWSVQWFKGIIDEVSIFDHALSDSEILANYNALTQQTQIPEFPTIALPIISVIGILFVLRRKK